MVLFNNGESTSDVKRWLQTRLRQSHASSVISNATEFGPLERFLLEKVIHAEGTANRLRIESDETGKSIIRAGSKTASLTREGLRDMADYLSGSGLKSHFQIDRHTPSAVRYNAAGSYYTQLERTLYDPLRALYGDDVSVSVETFKSGTATSFFDREFFKDGKYTALLRTSGEEGMMAVRAKIGDRYLSDEEMLRAATGAKGPVALNDINGKLAKRLTSAMMGDSPFQISLDRSLRAGFVNPQVLFGAMHAQEGRFPRGTMGSFAPDNVKHLLNNPAILDRGVDGAILINNKLLDSIIEGHKTRLAEVDDIIKNSAKAGGYEKTSATFHLDQKRRLQKNIGKMERYAERGGRFSNFRAMGFDTGALDVKALGLDSNVTENIKLLSESMAKGDALVLPRGGARGGLSNYELLMGNLQNVIKRSNPEAALDLMGTDFLAFTKFASKGGKSKPTLAAVGEIGLKSGQNASVILTPTETLGRVRTNVENITGARLLFRSAKGDNVDYMQGLSQNVERVIKTAQETGSIPVGYLRDLIKSLDSSEAVAETQGREVVAKSIANTRNRAVRLVERAMTGATFDDPVVVREFTNMLQSTMRRGGGKIDPILEMSSSVWGHVGTDLFAAARDTEPDAGSGLRMARTVANDHIIFDEDLGFIMNARTAGEAYHQFGGFDLDDALEAHLRWSKNEATGKVELFSLTTRTPMSGGEGGVFKVYGFEDSPDLKHVMPFVEKAVSGDSEAEEAFEALTESMDDLARRGETESISGLMDDFITRYIDRQKTLYGEDLPGNETGYEYAKRIMDRRISNQVTHLRDDDPLKALARQGAAPSEVFHGMARPQQRGIIRELAERGVLNGDVVKRGGEELPLWESVSGGGFKLGDDRIDEFIAQQKPSILDDILNNRILKMDTMSSYEAWANDFIQKDSKAWAEFETITKSRGRDDQLDDFMRRLDERPAGTAAKDWARKMIKDYDVNVRNPGMLGRTVNITSVIDEMNSGLMEMYEGNLIDDETLRSLRNTVPYMDTETLIDTLTQGADDSTVLERITRTYYGQLHGAGTLMRNMEGILGDVSAREGIAMDDLVERYGMSRRLFESRLGNTILTDHPSRAKSIFFGALGEELPEDAAEATSNLFGRKIFGGGLYEQLLDLEESNRGIVSRFRESHLSEGMSRLIPELRGEIFSNAELEGADYLQRIYESSREQYSLDLADMQARGNPIFDLIDEFKTTSTKELSNELAARNVVSAFTKSYVPGDEVAEEGWRVLGAFMRMSNNNQLINSSTFSPLQTGTQAFFARKKIAKRVGDAGSGMSSSELFSLDLEERYEELNPKIKAQMDKLAKEEFGGDMSAMRGRVAAEREASLRVTRDELLERGAPGGATKGMEDNIPSFDSYSKHGEEVMEDLTRGAHESIYERLFSRSKIKEYMEIPNVRKMGLGALAAVGFSFMYQSSQKREEEMLGRSLPGGGSYRTPIPTTQMEIASQYVPPDPSGVTYNVNVRGGGSGIRAELEALTGLSSGGARYNSLPKPQGSRADFNELENGF